MPTPSTSSPTLREHLSAKGGFGLAMSSGFFGFYAHTGLMAVLEEEGLLPSRISGSSAGALVGGAWASGVNAPVLARELEALERKHFWDPGWGWGLLRGGLFQEKLDRLMRASTFETCRVPARLSVFDVWSRRTRVLETGSMATAIQASCAVPLMFHPVSIEGRPSYDGGVLDRPGLDGMPSDAPVVLYHHLPTRRPPRAFWDRVAPRPGMVELRMEGLPWVTPFRLGEGRRAFQMARDAARRALDQPIQAGGVSVQA